MAVLKAAALAALLLAGAGCCVSGPAQAQAVVVVTSDIAPPPLPVYLQPSIPGPGYLWSPGYWEWTPAFGYYWVPGTWVLPPRPNLLWTPAYWGWSNGVYVFHTGYWGPQVGFYGGIVYGFGYNGTGFQGGYWNGGAFFYNRSVTNIANVNITNVYNQTVVQATNTNVSYNGGAGGTMARPTPQQTSLVQQPHEPPTPAQTQQAGLAQSNPALRLSSNHGIPPIAATPQPRAFGSAGVTAAQPAAGPATAAPSMIHRPMAATPANALPTGNALPAGRPMPTASQAFPPRPSGAGTAGVSPSPSPPAAPPHAPVDAVPLASGAAHRSSPEAGGLAGPHVGAFQKPDAMPQQRAAQMAHVQATRPQHAPAPRLAPPHMAAPRMTPPRMARPPRMSAPRMSQRPAGRSTPRRGHR